MSELDDPGVPFAPGGREAARHVRGSSLLLAGRVISLGLNLLVQIGTVRVLSKEGYGIFAYALSIAAVAEGILGLGLHRAVSRFLPVYEEEGDSSRVLGTIALTLATTLAGGCAAILLIVGLRGSLAGQLGSDPTAPLALAVLSLLAPLQGFDRIFLQLFSVFGRPRAIFVRRFVLGPTLRLAAVFVLTLREGGPVSLAVGYVVAGVIGLFFYGTMLVGLLRERGLMNVAAFRRMQVPAREVFAFALPLLSTEIVFVGIQQADSLMLGHFVGAAGVASLRAVVPLARLNQVVLEIFGILFTPAAARMFSRADHEGVNRLYWSATGWTAVLTFPIFAVTFSLARPLTSLLFGPEYADSGALLALLSLAHYVHASLGPNGLALGVYHRVRYTVAVNVLAFVLHIAGNLALIPVLGVAGAALATTVTLVVHNLLKQWGLRGTGVRAWDPGGARPLMSVGAGVAALVLLEFVFEPPGLVSAAAAAGAVVLVLAHARASLDVHGAFPELVRVPWIRRLVGGRPHL